MCVGNPVRVSKDLYTYVHIFPYKTKMCTHNEGKEIQTPRNIPSPRNLRGKVSLGRQVVSVCVGYASPVHACSARR